MILFFCFNQVPIVISHQVWNLSTLTIHPSSFIPEQLHFFSPFQSIVYHVPEWALKNSYMITALTFHWLSISCRIKTQIWPCTPLTFQLLKRAIFLFVLGLFSSDSIFPQCSSPSISPIYIKLSFRVEPKCHFLRGSFFKWKIGFVRTGTMSLLVPCYIPSN